MKTDFFQALKDELKLPLPGKTTQMLMAPKGREFPDMQSDATNAAVALIIFNTPKFTKEILFIKRPEYDGYHSGQVSFPGGKEEDLDSSFFSTAIRETYEETGVVLSEMEFAGKLTPLYIPVSKFMVHPYIFYLHSEPQFMPNPTEVQYLIQLSIRELLGENLKEEKTIEILGQNTLVPFFRINGEFVWGATAMILAEAIAIFQKLEIKNPGLI